MLWKPPNQSHNTGKQLDLDIHNHDSLWRWKVMNGVDPAANIVNCEGRVNLTIGLAA
ncbi:MAG: hypothetical protein ABJB85_10665 [Nitrososphaerota archaeon]